MSSTILAILLLPVSLVAAILRAFLQTVPLAIGQVWANKIRALLTALGIIIGVASVIAVIGGLTGFQSHVLAEFEAMGAKRITVHGYVPRKLRNSMSWSDAKPSLYEIRQVQENADSLEAISPVNRDRRDVGHGDIIVAGTRILGIWPDYHEIEDKPINYGRPFSRIDEEEGRQVCIINPALQRELTLPDDPTGITITIDRRRFLIVGIIEETQLVGPQEGGDLGAEIYIPFSTAKVIDPYGWHYISAQMRDPEAADEAEAEIEFILRQARGLRGDDENTFRVEMIQAMIERVNSMATVITAIATGIVVISLVVGGVGIMNIMLVSVSERTREIGLRKAVGAPAIVVLLQFLVEAVVLCTIGGLIGLAVGFGLFSLLADMVPEIAAVQIPSWAIILSLTFSGTVGLVFGIFPAIKAALLNPIDALRHE